MLKPGEVVDFAEELFLLDFSDDVQGGCEAPTNPNPSSQTPEHFFEEILDATVDGLTGLAAQGGRQGGDGDENEEEELEWLANKDAFPALETSFDLSVQSWSSSSAASGEHRSPVSVLASALPFRAPARSRSKGQRRRRKALPFFIPSQLPAVPSPPADAKGKRKCRHCESEDTPQWRAGPEGPKTLCNACGVRFKSGRLVPEYRPANSPTFSAAVHSNSHRRVVEMRRKKYGNSSPAGEGHGHGRGRRSFSAELTVM